MALLNKMAGGVLAAGLALGAVAAPASAEDKFGYSASLTIASDYMFRGISFTNEDPAFQPYIEGTYGMFYLGFWGSNIDNANVYGPYEIDVYAGVRPVTGPVNWDLGVLYYHYGSDDRAGLGPTGNNVKESDIDYFEFQIVATTSPITNLTLGIKGYYTPDQDFAISETGTVEGSIAYALPQMGVFSPTINAVLGYTTSSSNQFYDAAIGTGYFLGDDAYTYWNAGLKLSVEKFFMDFRYWDTDVDAQFSDNLADSRFVFSAGVALP
jgi:uncharacterized protein (TIGR02001 family)